MSLFIDQSETSFEMIKALYYEHGLYQYDWERLGGYIAQSYTNGVPNKLHHEIMHWLQQNKDVSHEDKLAKIKLTLIARGNFEYVLRLAAMSFFAPIEMEKAFDKGYGQRLDTLKAGKEIAENLAKERLTKKNKEAKQVKDEKFKSVWNELELYWRNNLTHIKSAPQTAKELEKTDIYQKSKIKPERGTLENYVRKWKTAASNAKVKYDSTA